MVCWLVFTNLTQTRVTRKEGTSSKELPKSDWPMGKSVGHFFLMVEVGGFSSRWAVLPLDH